MRFTIELAIGLFFLVLGPQVDNSVTYQAVLPCRRETVAFVDNHICRLPVPAWEVNRMEHVRRRAVNHEGVFREVNFDVPEERPFILGMNIEDGSVREFVEVDLFQCLIAARRVLESDGYLLCCQGARPNVFPSGMLRQMNDGRFAYVLTRDHPLSDKDVVDCFAEADASEIGTVEQQKDFVLAFFRMREGK